MSSPMPEFICPSSLLPFGAHDEDVLRLLALPVTSAMIRHVSAKLLAAVGAPGQQHLLPTPPVTPIRGKFALGNVTCGPEWEFPPLEVFLTRLVMSSDIHTSSVLSSMIYLKRIMKSLESDRAKHGPETPYRLAVALFSITSKHNLDVPPSNKFLTKCVALALGIEDASGRSILPGPNEGKCESRSSISNDCSPTGPTPAGYLFGPEAIAALERDVLYLLDYNLRFTEDELRDCLNPLSSHERAEGPVEQLRMAKGWSRRSLGGTTKMAVTEHTKPMQRAVNTLDVGPRRPKVYPLKPWPKLSPNPRMPSPPYTPKSYSLNPPEILERTVRGHFKSKSRPALDLKAMAQGLPVLPQLSNPRKCAPYPQLNPHMDVGYLFKAIHDSKLQEPFVPIGVPPAPPSTPVAGIDSLPFIYGGKVHPPTSAPAPTLPGLIVAPDNDSPWAHGQVGEILRKTMVHQAKKLAAIAANPPRGCTVLNTPPPVHAFGSGLLYLDDPNSSTVERPPPSKLTVSDVRWYRALEQPIPLEMLEGELAVEVLDELEGKRSAEMYDGMSAQEWAGYPATTLPVPIPAGHRAPHYQGVVVSGFATGLNTCCDHGMQARWAARWKEEYDGEDEDEEQYGEEDEQEYETAMKKRVLSWRSTIPRSGRREAFPPSTQRGQWEVSVSAAPSPLPRTPSKVGWLGKLIGRKSWA